MQEVHTSKKSCFNLLKNIKNDYVTDDMYSLCEILNITQRDGKDSKVTDSSYSWCIPAD